VPGRSTSRSTVCSSRRRVAAEAANEYAAARAVVAELTATLPDGPTRERFAARVATRLPASRTPSAARLARETHDGLTMRERDVAALIGRGLSNSDIAERLVISERTVESHTGRIYDKLGCMSRSQITTFDVVHDAVDPTGLLRSIRQALKPDAVFVRLPRDQLCGPSRRQRRTPCGAVPRDQRVLSIA
jgi:DNA-binding CsgD family transcriptional regulator